MICTNLVGPALLSANCLLLGTNNVLRQKSEDLFLRHIEVVIYIFRFSVSGFSHYLPLKSQAKHKTQYESEKKFWYLVDSE